jgi:hypothetical protein
MSALHPIDRRLVDAGLGLPPGRTPAVLREWARQARRDAAQLKEYAADLERQADEAERDALERAARVP